jgi:hypothetical protein
MIEKQIDEFFNNNDLKLLADSFFESDSSFKWLHFGDTFRVSMDRDCTTVIPKVNICFVYHQEEDVLAYISIEMYYKDSLKKIEPIVDCVKWELTGREAINHEK